MKLEWPDESESGFGAPPARDECLPAGEYGGTIARATVESGWNVTEKNPSGDCLSVWIDVEHAGRRHRIFSTIPTNWISQLAAIAEAAGVPGPVRGESEWDEQTLIGCSIAIETDTYIVSRGANRGQERPKIVKWIPAGSIAAGPKLETTQQRRARTNPDEFPTARRRPNPPRTEAPDDDIPF